MKSMNSVILEFYFLRVKFLEEIFFKLCFEDKVDYILINDIVILKRYELFMFSFISYYGIPTCVESAVDIHLSFYLVVKSKSYRMF